MSFAPAKANFTEQDGPKLQYNVESFSELQAFEQMLGKDFIDHIITMSNDPSLSAAENNDDKKHIDLWYQKSSYHKNSKYVPRPQADINEQAIKKQAQEELHYTKLQLKPVTKEILFKWISSAIVMSMTPQPALNHYFKEDARGIYGHTWFKRQWSSRDEFNFDSELQPKSNSQAEVRVENNESESQIPLPQVINNEAIEKETRGKVALRRSILYYKRKQKEKEGQRHRHRGTTSMSKPEFIRFYNSHKLYVDVADRMTHSLAFPHRFIKWTKAAFWGMISVALWNAHVLFTRVMKSKITFSAFLNNLIDEITGDKALQLQRKRQRRIQIPKPQLNSVPHLWYMVFPEQQKNCVYCYQDMQARGVTNLVKSVKKTSYKCNVCDQYMCKPCFCNAHNIKSVR